MLDHIKTLLWLKLILWKNTYRKGKIISVLFTAIFVISMLIVAIAVSIGTFFIGLYAPDKGSLQFYLLLIIDGLLIFFMIIWLIGLLTELQRSEIIDFRKMLYFPISLKMVFFLNFAISLITPASLFFLLPITTLTFGLCFNYGLQMIFSLFIAAAFFIMLAAWTYFFRGWLAVLLENKRRRRMFIAIASMSIILLVQVPNLINIFVLQPKRISSKTEQTTEKKTNYKEQRKAERKKRNEIIMLSNKIVPLGWFPLGVYSLSERKYLTSLICLTGICILGIIPLFAGYRSTKKFYYGSVKRGKIKTKINKTCDNRKKKRSIITWKPPFVSDDTGAVAAAGMIGYLRNPMFRMQFIMPIIGGGILLAMLIRTQSTHLDYILPFAIIYFPFFCFSKYIFNIFGVDKNSFSIFILMPIKKEKILLGKNLSIFFPLLLYLMIFCILGAIFTKINPVLTIIVFLQFVQIFMLLSIVGNFTSIFFPMPISSEVMRSQSLGSMNSIAVILTLFLMGTALTPSLFCLFIDLILARFFNYHHFSIGIILSLIMLPLVFFLYIKSNNFMGKLLMKRETIILEKLLHIKE